MKGKLKRSLKERCPQCGKILQLRTISVKAMIDGEIIELEKEFIECSNKNCDYYEDREQKRRRRGKENQIITV